MEIPISKIGKIIDSYQKLGYFDSDSLESAINKMKNDFETGVGISIQLDKNSEIDEVTLNKTLDAIFESL